MRNSPRIAQIWDTSKKQSRADICSIDNKILIFKNNLFSGSEQNAYCSETYSDHCQISKMECFETVADEFEWLPIFAKRSILDIFRRDLDTALLLTLIPPWGRNQSGTIEVIQRQKYQTFLLLFTVRSIF